MCEKEQKTHTHAVSHDHGPLPLMQHMISDYTFVLFLRAKISTIPRQLFLSIEKNSIASISPKKWTKTKQKSIHNSLFSLFVRLSVAPHPQTKCRNTFRACIGRENAQLFLFRSVISIVSLSSVFFSVQQFSIDGSHESGVRNRCKNKMWKKRSTTVPIPNVDRSRTFSSRAFRFFHRIPIDNPLKCVWIEYVVSRRSAIHLLQAKKRREQSNNNDSLRAMRQRLQQHKMLKNRNRFDFVVWCRRRIDGSATATTNF